MTSAMDVLRNAAILKPSKTTTLIGSRFSLGSGKLYGADLEAFEKDVNRTDFVLYSYATPIAWHHKDKGWKHISGKFSVTTTKQQNKARAFLK